MENLFDTAYNMYGGYSSTSINADDVMNLVESTGIFQLHQSVSAGKARGLMREVVFPLSNEILANT